jgi:hypothetical protein
MTLTAAAEGWGRGRRASGAARGLDGSSPRVEALGPAAPGMSLSINTRPSVASQHFFPTGTHVL